MTVPATEAVTSSGMFGTSDTSATGKNPAADKDMFLQLLVAQITAIRDEVPAYAHMRIALRVEHVARAGEFDGGPIRAGGKRGEQLFFLVGAIELPKAERGECRDADQQQRPRERARHMPTPRRHRTLALYWRRMTTLIIIAFLIVILYNLGAGLYYMMTDKGQTDRTVKALTWRIGLSVLLILLVIAGILTGVIKPHGLGH